MGLDMRESVPSFRLKEDFDRARAERHTTGATHLVIAEDAQDMFGIDCTIALRIDPSRSADLKNAMRQAVSAVNSRRQFTGQAYDLSVPQFEEARVVFPEPVSNPS